MNTYKGRPILGAVLGGLGALVLVLILMVGGIAPPTQFVVWGLGGLGVLVGSLMLTAVMKSARFVSILAIAVAMLAWSGLGFSAHNAHGDLSGGCNLEGASFDAEGEPLDAATPQETSIAEPFIIEPYGTIDWAGNTPGAFEGWSGGLAVDFAGFAIPVWHGGHDNSGLDPEEEGTVDVGSYVDDIEETANIELTGVLHLFGSIEAPDGACDMDAYLELPSDGLFSGALMIALWSILAIVAVVLIALMVPVCRFRKGLGGAALAGESATVGGAAATVTPADAVSATTVPGEAAAAKAPAKKSAANKAPAKKESPPTAT
jgi:hypothetical protein